MEKEKRLMKMPSITKPGSWDGFTNIFVSKQSILIIHEYCYIPPGRAKLKRLFLPKIVSTPGKMEDYYWGCSVRLRARLII